MSKTLDTEPPVASSLRSVCEALWLHTSTHGYPLSDFVADRRDQGGSWRTISVEIHTATDGAIDLPPQTLLNWYGAAQAAA